MTRAAVAALAERATAIRRTAVRIAAERGQGYVGQALGTADVLACLFFDAMALDGAEADRDRFVLSPGHYALAVYSAMLELGRYDFDELRTYGRDGSAIEESPLEGLPGFEITGGSLAQGLSQAIGIALGKRIAGRPGIVYCLISDGELQEGQTWEALLSAGHHGLTNLVVILDRNGRQVDGSTEEIVALEPLPAKLEAFGLDPLVVDGHDVAAIAEALEIARTGRRPSVLVCDTSLGRGAPELENADYPHYVRAEAAVWERALAAIG